MVATHGPWIMSPLLVVLNGLAFSYMTAKQQVRATIIHRRDWMIQYQFLNPLLCSSLALV
jgi:hypothetical protein